MEVELEGVRKSFGTVEALQPTTLRIADQQFVSLVGPSGSGKSTLVRLLAGLEKPDAGVMLFDGKPVQHLPANRRDIAMVFQSYALYPHMTVRDNLSFPLRMSGVSRSAVALRVNETAELLAIETLLDRKPRELSGGQRQRVALGRAIVRRPGLFLLDEPLSNLDAKLRIAMRTEIKRLHTVLKTTFVYVTHDQAEALTMSDQIVVLDAGRIQQIGSPMGVYHKPANRFVAEFIGSPPMAMLDGTLEQTVDGPWLVTGFGRTRLQPGEPTLREGPVTVGIRAEDVLVDAEPSPESFQARIYTREPLGSDLYLTLEVGGDLLRTRTDADIDAAVGTDVNVRLRTTHLHFFDRQTGESLAPADPATAA